MPAGSPVAVTRPGPGSRVGVLPPICRDHRGHHRSTTGTHTPDLPDQGHNKGPARWPATGRQGLVPSASHPPPALDEEKVGDLQMGRASSQADPGP